MVVDPEDGGIICTPCGACLDRDDAARTRGTDEERVAIQAEPIPVREEELL